MVWHVYTRARRSARLGDLLVATDSAEVMDACRGHGIPAVLTSTAHPSGTDRVWEVAQTRPADVYVNIQGDEPLVTERHIDGLVLPFLESHETQVTTLKIRLLPEEADNPNVNKVVCTPDRRAHSNNCPWRNIGARADIRAAHGRDDPTYTPNRIRD